MTVRDLLAAAAGQPYVILVWFTAVPVISFLLTWTHDRDAVRTSWIRYVYMVLVYALCMPGILAVVLTAYALFFTSENLLDVDALVYFLPMVSMAAGLLLTSRRVDFRNVPGFDRLSGLMALIGVTFVLVLAVSKTRIWVFFGASIWTLFLLVGGLFALLKWGAHMAFRRADEPPMPPPEFPSVKEP